MNNAENLQNFLGELSKKINFLSKTVIVET